MRLEQEFTVAAPAARVWSFLLDVPAMSQCIPGTSEVTAVDDTTYTATVTSKIGPIAARFGCKIAVLALDAAAQTGAVEISGRDSKIGGGITAKVTLALGEAAGQTTVRLVSDVDILGKIGQYGHGMVTKRANAMLDEFAACVSARLTDE